MKRLFGLLAAIVLVSPLAALSAQDMSSEAQIAEAVSPLPEPMRAAATVGSYDASGSP